MEELAVKAGNLLLEKGILVTVLGVGLAASVAANFMLLKIVWRLLPTVKSNTETMEKSGT